jgi:hypothetical protein
MRLEWNFNHEVFTKIGTRKLHYKKYFKIVSSEIN